MNKKREFLGRHDPEFPLLLCGIDLSAVGAPIGLPAELLALDFVVG